MSAADPFERLWLNPSDPGTGHASPTCASQSTDPIPSFAAFVDDDDRCGVCCGTRAPEVPGDVPVGDELRSIRETLGMGAAEVADRLTVGKEAVWLWEQERRRPSPEHHDVLRALADEVADQTPDAIDWDALEPAIRRVEEHSCPECGKTFASSASVERHQNHPATACGDGTDRCETCIETTDQLAYVVHRLEDHGIPQPRLDLEPGEFEDEADQADTLPELAERIGHSLQLTARLCRLYDIGVGPDTETPDGDDEWTAYYERAQNELGSAEP